MSILLSKWLTILYIRYCLFCLLHMFFDIYQFTTHSSKHCIPPFNITKISIIFHKSTVCLWTWARQTTMWQSECSCRLIEYHKLYYSYLLPHISPVNSVALCAVTTIRLIRMTSMNDMSEYNLIVMYSVRVHSVGIQSLDMNCESVVCVGFQMQYVIYIVQLGWQYG